MGIIFKVFNLIIWTIINLIYTFIDAIYSSFIKLNGINIINDLLTKDNTLIKAYNYIIVLSVVVLGFFAIWNYVKKFLEPDETPPVGTITLEIVKCTMLVVLSSFLLTQLFNFSMVFSGAMGNLFKKDNYSFSGSIVSSYVEISDKFLDKYEAGAQSDELKKFDKERQNNINGYIKQIKNINKELNKSSSITGVKYLFDENTYVCSEKKVKVSSNKENNTIIEKNDDMLSYEDKTVSTNSQLSLTDKINTRKEYCESLTKERNKKFEGKSSKFPETPDEDPFSSNGIEVKNKKSVRNFINNSFKGESYDKTNWYKKEIWNWHYVVKEGALGIDGLDTIEICWGGNTALLILVGLFLVYAMFFSGIMLARRQLEMLLTFFFSPIIFACSICNKQRRQSLYEQLSSLVLQAGAVMMVLGIGAILISKITTLNFGDGLEGLLIKSFFTCGVATLILTGSQAINRFIGSNVSANSGREALQSMAGFNSAIKGTAVTGGIATAGGLLATGKIARHPISSAKGVGSFTKNGVSGIMNSAKGKVNTAKRLGTAVAGAGFGALAGVSPTLGMTGATLQGASKNYKNQAQLYKSRAKQNKQNMSKIVNTARQNLSNPTLTRMSRMSRYGRRYF